MAKATKICRVCGKTYEACRTTNINNIFRWQDVSCSVECGSEYLRRVKLSRCGTPDIGFSDAQDIEEANVVTDIMEEIEPEDEYEGFEEETEEDELDELEDDFINEFISEE